MFTVLQLLSWFAFLISFAAVFSDTVSDYNAYGLRLAANDLMIVQADNYYEEIYILLGNDSTEDGTNYELYCPVNYRNVFHDEFETSPFYIYSVAVGKSPSAARTIFFIGEMANLTGDTEKENRTFVGTLTYNGSLDTIDCENGWTYTLQFVSNNFTHQEHLVLVADPLGTAAYCFSPLFSCSFTASPDSLTVHPSNSLSPATDFLPFAIDYDGHRGIVSGLLSVEQNERTRYVATVILFSINASTAIATPLANWSYPANSSTWQAGLAFTGADQYRPEYDMSVSINPNATQVLVGIQFMNSVFLFNYTTNNLTQVTSISRDRGIGFGKGVAWLRDSLNSIAILANVYSTTYIWSSSEIYIYDSPLSSNSVPVSTFPNPQQVLYTYLSPVFINILTTPDHLVFIDEKGYFFIIQSAGAGYYASTTGPDYQDFIAFSSPALCPVATYKSERSIRRCRPCPSGTKNNGTSPEACANCSTDAFCPLGSITDSISNDQLSNVTQVLAYPESPDVTGLDDILFFTLFSIGSTGRCVALSPIFWTLIVAAIVVIITIVMLIIKYCFKDHTASKGFKIFQKVFKQADLIREGNMWAGGLATFCVLVLCVACCVFSGQYYASYPIEEVGDSTYTCDTTLRNAQFSTSLRPLSIPVSDDMQAMINLLEQQKLNIDVAFLNTINSCEQTDVAKLEYSLGPAWLPIPSSPKCNTSDFIVTYYNAVLPFKPITIRYTVPNINIVGGLRVGMNAAGQNNGPALILRDFDFSQTLMQSGRMLGHDASVSIQLTKVINKTSPLVADQDDKLSGIWIGMVSVNYYESFLTGSEYLSSSSQTSSILKIAITETPYFILNEQSPIARLPEIIYHDFLFITMIIGMFVLLFVIIELMIIPSGQFLIRKCRSKKSDKYKGKTKRRSSATDSDSDNPSISSNKADPTKKIPQIATINDSTSRKKTSFASIPNATRGDSNNRNAPSAWKNEVYL